MKTTKHKELYASDIKNILESLYISKDEGFCSILSQKEKQTFPTEDPGLENYIGKKFNVIIHSDIIVNKEEDTAEYGDVMKFVNHLNCNLFVDQNGGEVVALLM